MSMRRISIIALAAVVALLFGCPNPTLPPDGGGGGSTVDTPVISPSSGSSIQQDSAVITITCATADASIYYTTDGTAPSASSLHYTAAFAVNTLAVVGTPLDIRAIGVKSGSTDSAVAQATYTVVDTESPIPVVTGPAAANAPFDVTITFNEDVTGFNDPATDIQVGNGTAGAISGGPRVFTSQITPSGTPVTVDIPAGACTDDYTNQNAASAATLSVVYDPTAPLGVITSTAANPTNVSPIPISIDFGYPVQGFDATDITVGNGSISGSVSGGPQVYTADVLPAGQGAVTVDISAGVCNKTTPPNTANLVSTQFSITYDNVGPDVTINQAAAQADPTNAAVDFTVVFTEPVADFNGGCVALSGTANPTLAAVTGSGTTYTVSVSGMTGDGTVIASLNAGVVHDAAGNGNNASSSTDNTVTYDATAPDVTIEQAAAQGDPTNASPINFTVVFTESVTDFATGDVTLSGTAGATTAAVTGSGTTYNVAVSGMAGDGTVIASLAAGVAHDAAGNGNTVSTSTDHTVTFEASGPTVTINQAVGQADPTNASPINFTVVFSKSVSDFADGDVTLSGTAGATTAAVTGSGTTYNVAVSGMTGDGTVIASLAAGVAHDGLGNPSYASSSTDNTVGYDVTSPTVTINKAAGQADPTNASPIDFTVVFSESVTGFASADVTLSGTAGAATAVVTGSGTTYNVAVSGMTGDGTVIASLAADAAQDAAGNLSGASTSTDNSVVYDTTRPTVTIEQAVGQADPTNASPINFTVVFSETVTDFFTGNVTLSGTAGPAVGTVTGSGDTYNVAVSGMTGDGTVIATLLANVAHDAAGNGNFASTSTDHTVDYDPTAPTVTINQAVGQADPANASPINFTVVFSESVSDFATGDVTITGTAGGTKTATVTGSGTTYNVAVTGMTDGTVIARLAAGVAHDAAGSGNEVSTSTDNTVSYDTTAPTVTINQAVGQSDPTNASPINFTVIFSESVSDFATGDVIITGTAGGTKTATVTGSGTTYNVAVTGMTDGTVIASLAAGVAHDAAGNASEASTSTDDSVTYDITAPTVTINQAVGQADPTNASPINFTVVFSESVADFATGDVTLSGTGGATTAAVTGSGTTYNVAVSGMTDGTVIASLGAAVAHDAAGNGNTASTFTDHTVTYDITPPTVTINQAAGQNDPTGTSPVNFTVVFDESVSDFATGDVTLSGTAGATTATVTGSGTTYNVAVSGMTTSGTVIASLAAGVAHDAATNASAASTSTDSTVTFGVQIDNTWISARSLATPTNLAITVANNPNRLLLVNVKYARGGGTTVSGITFNGTTMNQIPNSRQTSGIWANEFWYLYAPAAVSANVAVTFAAAPNNGAYVTAISLYNVSDYGLPNAGRGTAASVNISSGLTTGAANSMVIDGITGLTAAPTLTINPNQTDIATWRQTGATLPWSAGSWKLVPGSGTATTMTWTLGASQTWISSCVEVRVVP